MRGLKKSMDKFLDWLNSEASDVVVGLGTIIVIFYLGYLLGSC